MAQVTREVEEQPVTDSNVRREVVTERATPSSGILAQRIVWYIAGVIIALLALRMVFQLLGANEGNGFVDFIYSLSGVFAAPFFGMFAYEPSYGVSVFEVSTLVAIIIYALIAWGVAKLFTLNSRRTV